MYITLFFTCLCIIILILLFIHIYDKIKTKRSKLLSDKMEKDWCDQLLKSHESNKNYFKPWDNKE